jgi:hypothetical protein
MEGKEWPAGQGKFFVLLEMQIMEGQKSCENFFIAF